MSGTCDECGTSTASFMEVVMSAADGCRACKENLAEFDEWKAHQKKPNKRPKD